MLDAMLRLHFGKIRDDLEKEVKDWQREMF
jgi:hypothetical protein